MSTNLRPSQPKVVQRKKKKNNKKPQQQMKMIRTPRSGFAKIPNVSLGKLQSEFDSIMCSYANPRDNSFVRMANDYSAAASAVANPWAVIPQTPNGGSAAPGRPDISRDEGIAFVFRDPGRAYILYNPNPAAVAFSYAAYFVQTLSTPVSTIQIANNTGWDVPFAYLNCVSAYQPYDQLGMTYLDGSSPARYIWTNYGDTVTFTMSALAATSQYVLEWFTLYNGKMVKAGQNQVAGTAAPVDVIAGPFTSSGYVCFRFSVQVIAPQNFDFSSLVTINACVVDGADAVWEHHSLPGFVNNVGSVQSSRVASASLLLTNQAAQIYKQGRIAALQVPAGTDWTDIKTYDIISRSNGSKTLPAERGAYIFMKPTKATDFDYQIVTNTQNGLLYETGVPIVPQSSFLVVSFNIANTAASADTSTPAQNLYWTFAFGVEYMTTDVWREVRDADADPKVYELVLEHLSKMPAIYENPLHVSEILKRLKGVFQTALQGIVKYGPTALRVASALA